MKFFFNLGKYRSFLEKLFLEINRELQINLRQNIEEIWKET